MKNSDLYKEPLISFIIPFFNRYDKLLEAVKSITDSGFEDVEILLIDDCSSEPMSESIKQKLLNNKFVNIFRQNENQGPGAARNMGIKHSSGKYLFFLDSDDKIISENVIKLSLFLTNLEVDIIIMPNFYILYPDQRKEKKMFAYNMLELNIINEFLCFISVRSLYCFLFRRVYILKNDISFLPCFYQEDTNFVVKSFLKANSFKIFNDFFYQYTKNSPNSISLDINKIRNHDRLRKDIIYAIEDLEKRTTKNAVEKKLVQNTIMSIISISSGIIFSNIEIELFCRNLPIKLGDNFDEVTAVRRWYSDIYKKLLLLIVKYPKKNIFICPCSSGGIVLADVINKISNKKILAFYDANPSPKVNHLARNCINAKYKVLNYNDYVSDDTKLLLLFGAFAYDIEKKMIAKGRRWGGGMVKDKDYMICVRET